ncbi:hypothetical protein VE00_08792 [Pseudogymnoascus sp. WSF 3629]|nr:hypothetical protein VE00_08792 [Pseudogymnoascus sp. WSF 3629]
MANAGNPEFYEALQHRVRVLEVENTRLNAEVLRLLEQLAICREKYGPNCCDWRVMLRQSGYSRDAKIRKKVEQAACKKFNMSSVYQNHGLYYVQHNHYELEREDQVLDTGARFHQDKFFDFTRLVNEHKDIALKIAIYAMVKHDDIHVVARFDVHGEYPPPQGGLDPKSGLSYRFHWGGSACAINSSPLPRDVLAPIFVCRDWHDIFATAFYALNVFSFRSLGEFDIFCQRTPVARRQRIRAMKLTWIGSKMDASKGANPNETWDKSRWGTHKLNEFNNLESLEINLNELKMRRPNEPGWAKRPLLNLTKTHDNCREYRDLRKLRGSDNIYQLRGLKHVAVFDNGQDWPRAPVRDQTFVEDMRRQVYSPKSEQNQKKAKLKNLKPLLRRNNDSPKWVPSKQVYEILKKIFKVPVEYMFPDGLPDEMDNASDSDDDDEDDNQHPDDDPDNGSDDGDDDQGGNDDRNLDDNSDSESDDDDDAPDQGANASRAAPAASSARNSANGGGENGDDGDEDIDMDRIDPKNAIKSEEDSDDDGFEFIHSAKPSPIKIEDDDELTFIGSNKRPEVEFIRSVKRSQTIDLSQLPDMEDPDTVFPSIEGDEVKEEVKSEDPTGAEGMESVPVFEGQAAPQPEARSPFGPLYPRRGLTEQSSLFVRRSTVSRRSFSSRVFGYFGTPSSERKRSIEDEDDDDDDDVVARPGMRRRLSHMTMDEEDMEE